VHLNVSGTGGDRSMKSGTRARRCDVLLTPRPQMRENPFMQGQLLRVDGSVVEYSRSAVEDQLASGTFFWLDLIAGAGDGDELFRETFTFHPLAVEDAEEFGQRPKFDDYDDFVFMALHGADPDSSGTVEVHCFYSDAFLVTVHRKPCPCMEDVRRRAIMRLREGGGHPIMLLYRVADSLIESFLPVLAELDDRIDQIEDEILLNPTNAQLGELFDMKRTLVGYRKVITPQRDMFSVLVSGADGLPGMTRDAERYFRDVYDHLIRISDLVDSYRDLLSGVMDTHLSVTSNRLNAIMKQLTIIATVFLPLTFLTGFFGQNFGWLVARITGSWQFWAIGVGIEMVAVVLLFAMFRIRRWI
jgi:magnesium transporter